MSELLQSIRAKYPVYADTPDDELTVGIGDKYPVYLSQDPQFRGEYLKAKAQTSFSGLGEIQPPGALQPRLATTPAVTGAEAVQPTQIEAVKREAQQAIPALSPEEAEKIATTPFVSLPRMNDREMPATSAMVNVGEGLIEQALLTPASGAMLTAFKIPGVRTAFAAVLGAAATKAGAGQIGEASVTGNRQQIAEGALTAGLGLAGAVLAPRTTGELAKMRDFSEAQVAEKPPPGYERPVYPEGTVVGPTPETEVQNARPIISPAKIHGDVRTQPEQSVRQMPEQEGIQGVLTEAERGIPPISSEGISKPPPSSSETVAWDSYYEDLVGDLDSFAPARETGKRSYEMDDVAQRFVDFARRDKSSKSRLQLVKDFADQDDASKSQIKKLRASVENLEKSKPAPTSTGQVPQIEAPAEPSAVSEASKPRESPPGEAPAISQATTEGQKAQAVDPVEKFVGSVEQVPEGKAPPTIQKPLGVTPFPGVTEALGRLVNAGKAVVNEIRSAPAFTPFKEALNAWNGKNQLASLQIRRLQKTLESKVKDPLRREAISNWLQADGDTSKLAGWEASSKGTRKAGYKAAQNLTSDEVKVAQSVRQLYDDLLARAQAYGILDQGLENYVTQIWKRTLIPGSGMTQFMSKLSRNFKFARQRTFENFFEGEQSGFKPVTKDISQLLGLYVSELEKTIATRDLIKDLTTKTASDGNPLAMPEGVAAVLTDEAGDASGPMFVKPGVLKSEVPYAQIDNPALAKWKWATKDPESGRDVFMLGELRVHPEIARHLRNALGQSQIAKWLREPSPSAMLNVAKGAGRLAATASQLTKEVMLGTLSTFHHVQEGTHAVGHRINPFMPDKMPIDAPEFKDALSHGLQVAGDRAALDNFREGLGAQALFGKLGPVGRFIQRHNDFLFNEYIPRLKWATYQAILDRNMARFEPEMRSGRVSNGDVKYLSAQQANAAYGHLNYADLGRNPTVQHFLRLAALAPDFLEARSRFAGQAIKGLTGKAGREQLEALAILAGTFYVGARILNKLTTGDWNTDEPFGVRVGNRTYRMRSVPEDIWRLFKDTRQFVYGRLNPIFGRGTAELLTGRNYRGEKITASETFKEALTSWVPIQMRGLPGFKSLTETQRNATINAWEQFLGSIGIQVSRYSPVSKVYQLANDWRKAQGEKEDRGTYPVSKYQPMRYALEDGDLKTAEIEYNKLVEAGLTPPKIMLGFREALNHPFTGSTAKDRAFKNSLTPENKALYDEALQQRRRIWNQFQTMRSGVGIKP